MNVLFASASRLASRLPLQASFCVLGAIVLAVALSRVLPLNSSAALAMDLLLLVIALYLLAVIYFSILETRRNLRLIIEQIASGDLSLTVDTESATDSSHLAHALKQMHENLLSIVSQVRESSTAILGASSEIAAGNTDLSERTEEQASSLEQTASNMEVLARTLEQNADLCAKASAAASGVDRIAAIGADSVRKVVEVMALIEQSSKRIVDIIGVIEGIAFQTNILAINAAVEAARAQEHGRGFAVVASEVRHLAQRSAAAAKEIKNLIGDSMGNVVTGTQVAATAGQTIEAVVASAREATQLIREIASSSRQQSEAVGQAKEAIHYIDRTTQQNAALVEQSAAAALALESEARRLDASLAAFYLDRREDRDTVVRLVKRAAAHVRNVGAARACRDFCDPHGAFVHGERFIFANDFSGLCRAHGGNPSMVGQDHSQIQDPDGKLFVKEMIDIARSRGCGWCDYQGVNPITRMQQPKSAYIERVDDMLVGCGIFKGTTQRSAAEADTPLALHSQRRLQRGELPRLRKLTPPGRG